MKELGTRCNLALVLLALTTMLGCGALNASKPASQQSSGLVAATAVLDFGATDVGNSVVRTNTVVNNTRSPIVITRAQTDQSDFRVTGVTLPVSLAPGHRIALQVVYSPQSGGDSQGTVVLVSNVMRSSATFTLRGTGIAAGRLKLTPARIGFGNTTVGHTQTQSATLSNAGINPVTISQVAISGAGFTLTGLSVPLTLNAGQSVPLGVNFKPGSGGPKNAMISLIGTATVSAGKKRPGIVTVASTTAPTTLNVPVSGTAMAAGQLAISPSSLALGRVTLGGSQTLAATVANSGASTVTVSNATVTGRGFRMSGLNFPLTLHPGQKKNFSVTFTPQAAGTASGTVVVASDAPNSVVNVPVSAEAIAPGALSSNPSSLSFGSVQVGQSQTLLETITNSGGSSVTVSRARVSSDFVISGLNLPVILAAGQSTAFSVTYSPRSGGPASDSLSITSDASNSSLSVPLTATGLTAGSLTASPSSLAFGTVQVGSPKTISGTLTNSGGTSVTVSSANSSSGFTVTGLNLPATLGAGQSTTFNVTFTPQSGGSASGSLSVASNASNSTLTIPLVAVANTPTAGVLSTSDSSLDFGSVALNNSATQSETLTNSGGSSVTVSQANVSGTGFRVTGLNLPLTLSPGQSFTFGAVFTPTSGGNASGSISVVSDATDSLLTITLAGTASVSGQLAVSPATLNFGNVTVGQSKSLTATLAASGSSVVVSGASMSTSEFTVSGVTLPLTLAAGQSKSFTINFAPQASGTASANASFASNASNSSAVQALTGSGTAALQHTVALAWNPSTSNVVGYNVYRGVTSGGPYAKITSMNADTSFTDSSVDAGQTYFYVTTAVDGNGKESANSNQTQAVVPTP